MALNCEGSYLDVDAGITDICLSTFDDVRVEGYGEEYYFVIMYEGQAIIYDDAYILVSGES